MLTVLDSAVPETDRFPQDADVGGARPGNGPDRDCGGLSVSAAPALRETDESQVGLWARLSCGILSVGASD